jgi:hypothetical protein
MCLFAEARAKWAETNSSSSRPKQDVLSDPLDSLAIPGGGVGIFAQGCPAQFGVSQSVFGAAYGGVSSADQCKNLPAPMQDGCQFRFGWFKGKLKWKARRNSDGRRFRCR